MAGAEYGSWRNMIWPIRLSTRAMPSSVCLSCTFTTYRWVKQISLFLQHIIKDLPYSTSLTLDIILMLLYTIGSITGCREIDGRLGAQEYIVFISTSIVITGHHMICYAPTFREIINICSKSRWSRHLATFHIKGTRISLVPILFIH